MTLEGETFKVALSRGEALGAPSLGVIAQQD
jgi:hypothetical protein